MPVVNENDSTATDEITFGDNDALAAQVAVLLRARLLVLLTDQDGLYTRDPQRPRRRARARGARPPAARGDRRRRAVAQRPRLGRHALEDRRGRDGVGRRRGVRDRAGRAVPRVLEDAVAGRNVGTRFFPDARPGRELQAVAPLRPAELGAADRRRGRAARGGGAGREPARGRAASGRGTLPGRRRRHDLRARRHAVRQGPRGGRRLRAAPCRGQAIVRGRAGRGRASRLSCGSWRSQPLTSRHGRGRQRASSRSLGRGHEGRGARGDRAAHRARRRRDLRGERGGRRRCPRRRHERARCSTG